MRDVESTFLMEVGSTTLPLATFRCSVPNEIYDTDSVRAGLLQVNLDDIATIGLYIDLALVHQGRHQHCKQCLAAGLVF